MKIITKNFLTIGAFLIAALLIGFSLKMTQPARAQFNGQFNFGGRILDVEYCCNGVAITVGPPSPGVYLFDDTSTLYPYYNVFSPGPNVVGSAIPGGVCEDIGLLECLPVPVLGTIVQVGTSSL